MNKLLVEQQQHGFRGERSCETQLILYTVNDLAHNREVDSITEVVIPDFSKAFDTVSHKKFFHIKSLVSALINARLVSCIKEFLLNRG